MPKGIYLLNAGAYNQIYGPAEQRDIAQLVDLVARPQTGETIRSNPDLLHEVNFIFSGWGLPKLDEAFLSNAPNLKAVFYGAGSIKSIVTDAFWARGIPITSSYAANAVPVIEYTLSQIFFCLKRGWYFAQRIKNEGRYPPREAVPGGYGSTVGIISLGMIGRGVCKRLQSFDLNVIAYDPFVTLDAAADLNVELVSLDDLFRRADVVSLHTPWLKETEGLITGVHFAMMKENATFINTARGAIVREKEMIEVLQQRTDLWAILDVTYPEPPVSGSLLYTMPNVILTPHLAGSRDDECRRMGRIVVEELGRYLKGQPLRWAINREQAAIMA
jgi:phosphoglycerate dehydrogenase-like enzyme